VGPDWQQRGLQEWVRGYWVQTKSGELSSLLHEYGRKLIYHVSWVNSPFIKLAALVHCP
jgi:hypothetical protein